MTPALAALVASGGATDWDEVLDGVRSALDGAFTVLPEQGGTGTRPRRRTWLDTFDWRLHRAGLLLEYVSGSRSGELVLSSASAEAGHGGAARDGATVQKVTGWRAARPHLAPDLPPGPVTEKIAGLIHPRALLPAVTVASTTESARLLNDDGKTVARLLIEHPLVGGEPLPPRIAIAEVRGYAAQARRAAELAALAPGVERGPQQASPGGQLLSDALACAGRQPGDYSGKVRADITAAMPAARAIAVILLGLLDTLQANVDGVVRDTDIEFLHDLRVAVRRTRAAIKLLGDALGLDDEQRGRFAAEFKWLGDLTTPVRDLDVHLLGFADMAGALKAAPAADLEPFHQFLTRQRGREFRALARGLRSARFTRLAAGWRATLQRAAGDGDGAAGADAGPAAREVAAARTRKAYRKVARRGAAITADSPHEMLHDLRKRCKELRYALEFFAPLHDKAAYAAVLGDLKALQDCLGDFQDYEVQIEEIRTLAGAMQQAGVAPAATLLAMGEITAGLAAGQERARDAFEARFTRLAGPLGQRHMKTLLAVGDGR